jgi:hypothetical protein
MNKNQIIDAFNNHFIEFITDVERVFPSDSDISLARKSISKSVVLLPKLLIRLYNEYFVAHYSREIEEGNIDFFVENNYRSTYGYKENDDAWAMAKIDCLREPVKNMNADDKEKVIQYLKNLKKLSDLYLECKSESKKDKN